jgi:hypothetical protein
MSDELSQAVIAITTDNSPDMLLRIQKFQNLLNKEPAENSMDKTADGKAKTVTISHIEMTLDELFFGQWSLSEPQYQREFNEVIGSAVLTVIHPITGREIKRLGFAAILIMQDKDSTLADFNSTKKKNALDLSFPKLKAEILKNAAQSLGKVFGRDINRKAQNVDKYNPLFKGDILPTLPAAKVQALIDAGKSGNMDIVTEALKLEFNPKQKEEIANQLNLKLE